MILIRSETSLDYHQDKQSCAGALGAKRHIKCYYLLNIMI